MKVALGRKKDEFPKGIYAAEYWKALKRIETFVQNGFKNYFNLLVPGAN